MLLAKPLSQATCFQQQGNIGFENKYNLSLGLMFLERDPERALKTVKRRLFRVLKSP
jgi:hypothetical protein